jgi:predicted nucleotidyltransferase
MFEPRAHPAPDAALHATVRDALARALGGEPGIDFAYLHGSFDEGLPFHDVDVAVQLLGDLAATEAYDLCGALALLLSRAIGYDVDVHAMNGAPLGYRHSVLRGTLLFASDDERLCDYIERAAIERMDYFELAEQQLHDSLRP